MHLPVEKEIDSKNVSTIKHNYFWAFLVGLYLSDIPIHDATRDLILLSEHRNAECALTQRLQIVTDKLQQTARELKKEQQLADKLLYSILPPSVANELRLKRPIKAKKFEVVTVLFSGIVNFAQHCNDITEPMEIVNLLNNIYMTFDNLMDTFEDVYKVIYTFFIHIAIPVQ
jgi:guanylate cyclase soluble subunit beta